MSKQLHKNFVDEQVKLLLKSYVDKEIKINYILSILGIKTRRFFKLLNRYKKDLDNFSIQYNRKTINRKIDKAIVLVLRRRYKIDHLPVRGLIRVKVSLRFKIWAINCKRLIKEFINRPKANLPALLYHHLFSLFSFQRTYRVKFAT